MQSNGITLEVSNKTTGYTSLQDFQTQITAALPHPYPREMITSSE
jgi:hypothetical protein